MMFAAEKLFSVSEHREYLDPCQVLNRDIQNSAQLRKKVSIFSSDHCSGSKKYLLKFFYCT